jgi:hypothetical protein
MSNHPKASITLCSDLYGLWEDELNTETGRLPCCTSSWIPANVLAGMLGMVVSCSGTSLIPAAGISWRLALLLLLFVVAAGALVGAAHGVRADVVIVRVGKR